MLPLLCMLLVVNHYKGYSGKTSFVFSRGYQNLPFSDSAEDICLDVYLILLMVEHVKTQTWHITIHANSCQQCYSFSFVSRNAKDRDISTPIYLKRFVLVYILHDKNSM